MPLYSLSSRWSSALSSSSPLPAIAFRSLRSLRSWWWFLSGDGPKIALAALSVFFTTLVATVLGLRSMDAASVDVIRSSGGGAWKIFRLVRAPGALPNIFAGLRLAAPAALLGAVIGEYLGASEGLGVALIQAQSSFEVPRTWGVALVMSALAGLLYAVASVAARVATPWVGRDAVIGLGTVNPTRPTAAALDRQPRPSSSSSARSCWRSRSGTASCGSSASTTSSQRPHSMSGATLLLTKPPPPTEVKSGTHFG